MQVILLLALLVAVGIRIVIAVRRNRKPESAEPFPETIVRDGYDIAEMEDAIARGRATVDRFILSLERQEGSEFCVKVPITDEGQTEHFWLDNLGYKNGMFTGKIADDPGVVQNVKFGQKWSVHKNEISDWMFMRDRRMYGNFTLVPLLQTMDLRQVFIYMKALASEEELERYLASK